MSELLSSILGDQGNLKKAYPHFIPRAAQLTMAEAVEYAIDTHTTLVVEAGTGIGKTFAYLIPALLSDKKILVSTGTKNLQDQLFRKDLPILKKFLAVNKKMVLLKGRSNYACLYRLDAPQQHQLFESKEVIKDFAKIQAWSKLTTAGDLSECDGFSEDAGIWQHVTSTAESCLGNECEFYEQCFVVRARKEALSADVVVINHHLFFADMSLKEESVGKLLPDVDTVIFDEAHQLYDAASSFLSERFSSRQLLLLIRDIQSEYAILGADHPTILRLTLVLKQELTNLRLHMGDNGRREAWFEIAKQTTIKISVDNLAHQLSELTECLAEQSQRSKGLENAWQRSQLMSAFLNDLSSAVLQPHAMSHNNRSAKEQVVFWFEVFLTGFMIYKTPIDFSGQLSVALNDPKKAWIYTSATLDAGTGMEHFTQPLGIQAHKTLLLESPYHYHEQARLYFPRYLPDVTDKDFVSRWVDAIAPLCEAASGRTFLLFTSYRAMQEAYEHLSHLLQAAHDSSSSMSLRGSDCDAQCRKFTLLMQGQASKHTLLEQFKTNERMILLATSSFWQGVDVQGAALCCVCIDKLPFASPGDPVTKARINAYKSSGKDPFYDYQLPQAVIMLKQGVGRLIRSETDKGVLVIGDMRMLTRKYGAAFLKAMPKALIVRDEDKVVKFLQEINL